MKPHEQTPNAMNGTTPDKPRDEMKAGRDAFMSLPPEDRKAILEMVAGEKLAALLKKKKPSA